MTKGLSVCRFVWRKRPAEDYRRDHRHSPDHTHRFKNELQISDRAMHLLTYVNRTIELPEHIVLEYTRLVEHRNRVNRNCALCRYSMKFEETALSDCGHMFHAACLEKVCEKQMECPICKATLAKWCHGPDTEEQNTMATTTEVNN